MQMDLESIGQATGVLLSGKAGQRLVTSVVTDSRKVGEGSLFVCLAGTHADGHDFALQAAANGAVAILAERPLPQVAAAHPEVPVLVVADTLQALGRLAHAWRRRFAGLVVGLTGTAGKTTVKEWLSAVLATAGPVARTEGNFNNQLGLPLSLAAADGHERYWVFEAGVSHPHDMEELAAILRPDIGIVLNVGEGHTEGLGEKGVAWHKSRLFAFLAPGGRAIASADYPDLVTAALGLAPDTLFFSAGTPDPRVADRLAARAVLEPLEDGTARARVILSPSLLPGQELPELLLHLPFAGLAAAENCACVALAALCAGLPAASLQERLQKGLGSASIPQHRFCRLPLGPHLLIDDAYNANPLSMQRMLEAAAAEARARGTALGLVLGAMGELGDMADRAHRELGAHIADLRPAFVFWKGPHAAEVQEGLGSSLTLRPFADEAQLAGDMQALVPTFGRGITILCKGSRSNELERAARVCRTLLGGGK